MRTRRMFLHVIARSAATWQSVLLAVQHHRKQYLRRIRSRPTNSPNQQPICQAFLQGRGLPHQCAHWFAMTCKRRVRVSECKAVLPSKPAGGCGFCHWADVLANADTQQISACHCEERSDVAIRSPCSTASQKAVLWANTKKCYKFAQAAYHKSPGNRGRRRTFPCAGLTFAGFSAIM